eukprot:TRINITY_DN11980_c0_g1_i1.p1 TRINITY_DN11980_c0_g1~~TRINITY_DN11980_c0_g1_i1.p1  ORF type:complete len:186 (-),score=44.10 TRINITY_DN11980_c0_g1_i1:64-621(-)
MRSYFRARTALRVVFHLVDGRHGPLADDVELMEVIAGSGTAAAYVVVLTKVDKLDGERVRARVTARVAAALAAAGCPPDVPVVATSAASRLGRDEMWRYLQLALVEGGRDGLDGAAVPVTGEAGGRRGGGAPAARARPLACRRWGARNGGGSGGACGGEGGGRWGRGWGVWRRRAGRRRTEEKAG